MTRARRSWEEGHESWSGDWTLPPSLLRPLSPADREAVLALSCAGVGPGALVRLLARVRSPSEAAAGYDFGCDPTFRMQRVAALGARVVVASDDEYPQALLDIAAPPPLLYVRGAPLDSLAPSVAVVGARACTSGGRRFAHRLGAELAEAGFTVVSGLARGIDAAAHRGALETGRSAAVLGTGIELVYPAEHRELADALAERGAVLTEFPPGTGPRAWHFPARNRIVSGLCLAVIVVEAGLRSGALITAGFALDHGRDVYACTTGPENPAGAGVRELLRDGARLVVCADDVVGELTDLAAAQGTPPRPVPALAWAEPSTAEPDGDAARVLQFVTEDASMDAIAAAAGLSVGRTASLLASLELDGAVVREPGGLWRRA